MKERKSFVEVTQPETKSNSLKSYTTYLIQGNYEDGERFTIRKRYSDFEALRGMLWESYPGVCLPLLPQKKFTGRFDAKFVETRREGLESFMRDIFDAKYFDDCPILRDWTSSHDIEVIKKNMHQKKMDQLYENYQNHVFDVIFANDEEGEDGREETETSKFRELDDLETYLDMQRSSLQKLMRETEAYLECHQNLVDTREKLISRSLDLDQAEKFCQKELSSTFRDGKVGWRVRITDALRTLGEVSHNVRERRDGERDAEVLPYDGWEFLTKAIKQEFDETESIFDAFLSIKNMKKSLETRQTELQKFQMQQNYYSANGATNRGSFSGIGGSGLTTLFSSVMSSFGSQGSNNNSQSPLSAHEQKQVLTQEIFALQQWVDSATRVLVHHFFPRFYEKNIKNFKKLSTAFARANLQVLTHQKNVWKEFLIDNDTPSNNAECDGRKSPISPISPVSASPSPSPPLSAPVPQKAPIIDLLSDEQAF